MSGSHSIDIRRDSLHAAWRLGPVSRLFANYIGVPMSVLAEQATMAARLLTGSRDMLLFRRFWGGDVAARDVELVVDSYENVVLRNRFRWSESRHQERAEFGREVVPGSFTPHATALLTGLFLKYTGKELRIVTDLEHASKREGALVCYGSSDSNFKTFELEAESGGVLCQFTFDDKGERGFRVGGNTYSIEIREGVTYDKAIVLRLAGQTTGQCRAVCAGLSEWGNLAAVQYLVRNWKTLHQRFDGFGQRRDFCILLEVPFGRPEEARERAAAVWWHQNGRM